MWECIIYKRSYNFCQDLGFFYLLTQYYNQYKISNQFLFNIFVRMKVYRIEEFTCNLCSEWFNSYTRIPLKLRCGHNVCKYCIEQNHYVSSSVKIVCPEDYEINIYKSINDIEIDFTTKSILERISGQEVLKKNNNRVEVIKEYVKMFDQMSYQANLQINKINQIVDGIYKEQIMRIESIWTRTKLQVNRPIKIIQDWKELVKNFLGTIRKYQEKNLSDFPHFEYYLEEANRVALEVNNFISLDKQNLIFKIMNNKRLCFHNDFSFFRNEHKVIESVTPHTKDTINIKKNNRYDIIQTATTKIAQENILGSKSKQIQLKEINLTNNNNLTQNKLKENLKYIKDRKEQEDKEIYYPSKCYTKKINPETLEEARKRRAHLRYTPGSPQSNSLTFSNFSNSTNLRGSLNNNEKINQTNQKYSCNDDKTAICEMFQLCKGSSSSSNSQFQEPIKNHYNVNEKSSLKQFDNHNKLLSLIDGSNQTLNQIEQLNQQMLLSAYESTTQDETTQIQQQHTTNQYNNQLRNKIMKIIETKPYNFMNFYKVKEKDKENINNNNNKQNCEVRTRNIYDCEMEKYNYTLKMKIMKVQEAILNTIVDGNFIELINHPLETVDFRCYLELQNWNNKIQILKFVKTNLQDYQLNILLNFVLRVPSIHTLVISNNQLTDDSLDILLQFLKISKQLKSIYLSKNPINSLKSKNKINALKSSCMNVYI